MNKFISNAMKKKNYKKIIKNNNYKIIKNEFIKNEIDKKLILLDDKIIKNNNMMNNKLNKEYIYIIIDNKFIFNYKLYKNINNQKIDCLLILNKNYVFKINIDNIDNIIKKIKKIYIEDFSCCICYDNKKNLIQCDCLTLICDICINKINKCAICNVKINNNNNDIDKFLNFILIDDSDSDDDDF